MDRRTHFKGGISLAAEIGFLATTVLTKNGLERLIKYLNEHLKVDLNE